MSQKLSPDVLKIDAEAEVERISAALREILRKDLNRRGLIIAISGGVDSAVCAALCVKALGPGKVFGLLLREAMQGEVINDEKIRGKIAPEDLLEAVVSASLA